MLKKFIKFRRIILLSLITLIILITTVYININSKVKLSDDDKEKILQVVNQYYDALENRNFYSALEVCNLDGGGIDYESRIIVLEEVWSNIIEDFKLEYKANKINYYEEVKKYAVSISFNLRYKNTRGASLQEIVFLSKEDDEWKISMIRGVERYGLYRVGEYQYIMLIELLNPKYE